MKSNSQEDSVHFVPQNRASDDLLVKIELRKTIQLRREAKGLGTIEIDEKQERNTFKLTKEEKERVKLRRERNRLSAQKCRKRRREQLSLLGKEARNVVEANKILESEIEWLERERAELARMLCDHSCNMIKSVPGDVDTPNSNGLNRS